MKRLKILDLFKMQEDREPEIWKPIPGYEGIYEISSWGNVRSLERWQKIRGNSIRLQPSKLLSINYTGVYPQICLSKNNQKKSFRVHLIVDFVFFDIVDYDYIINHKDLNKKNNYYKNIERINHRENTSHYFKNNFEKTSKFTGVSYDKSKPKRPWVASFRYNKKCVKLGNFESEEEAHQVYLEGLDFYGLTNKYATENQD